MTNNGWRTVVIESGSNLSFGNECLNIETGSDTKNIPIKQIGILLIDERKTVFSAKVLSKLVSENVKIIFCDEKHKPQCEIIPYYANSLVTANFKKQIKWEDKKKDLVWQRIVRDKIAAQAKLVAPLNPAAGVKLLEYFHAVEPGDKTSRESQAARVYFNALFGNNFRRRTESPVNAALNYGYTVLLSTVNRFVSIYGYHTALGINHKSDNNPYNLSCDLMEPFRPVIDAYVYENKDRELDIFYKREIIERLYSAMEFERGNTTVISAIEQYVECTLKELSSSCEQGAFI